MTTIRVGVLGLTVLLAACSGSPSTPSATAPTPSTPAATASAQATALAPSPSGDLISGKFDVDGRTAFIECKGTGSPTVIFEAGLDSDSRSAAGVVGELAATTRTCRYDRAGLGFSQSHSGGGDLSAGDRARDLHALLEVVGVEGPYVLVGFSYGGMIVRTFTDQFADEVAGLVFLDATHEDAWAPGSWYEQFPQGKDGSHAVDRGRTRDELGAADDLGDRPTIVLTAGRISGEHERHWTPIQDKLAALSSNSLHMVATEADHDVRGARPELVRESIVAVVEAVRRNAAAGLRAPLRGPRRGVPDRHDG